jgi:prophage regulatory protein
MTDGSKPQRYLSLADLADRGIPFVNDSLLRMEKAGKFPRRVRLGYNRVVWVESEIDEWMAQLVSERDMSG